MNEFETSIETSKLNKPMKFLQDDRRVLSIPCDKVTIPSDRKQRKDLGNIDKLCEGFRKVGQLQPIVVMRDWGLVFGWRRLNAARLLGWERIDALIFEELEDYERKMIELEENLNREDITWDEKKEQIAALHGLKVEHERDIERAPVKGQKVRYKAWTMEDTALSIGVSKSKVSEAIKLTEAIKEDPTLRDEKNENKALIKIKKKEIEEIRKLLAERAGEDIKSNVWLGDALELLKEVESGSIGLVITDTPYGAEVEKIYEGSGRMEYDETKFRDEEKESLELVKSVRDDLFRVLMDGSHLYMFVGFDLIKEIREWYAKGGFNVRHLPLIWDKIVKGFCSSKDYQWARNYECILFMSKGAKPFNDKARLQPHRGDVLGYQKVDSGKKVGINEKPLQLMMDFIQLSSVEGEKVLDPFCGSGVVGIAAKRMKRRFLLMDDNEKAIRVAKTKLLEEEFRDENDLG